MKKSSSILLFLVFTLVTTVFFQNCGEMKSADGLAPNDSLSVGDFAGEVEKRVVPDFLVNRQLNIDNKVVSAETVTTSFSLGGADIFYYETDYRATYKSSLVTVTGNGRSQAVLKVEADDCDAAKILSREEGQALVRFFIDNIPRTEIRNLAEDEVTTQGCAFPRLALDAKEVLEDGSLPADFDIYFTTAECTADNEFYVTNRGGNDPAAALAEVQTFFNGQIDTVCGF